MNRFIFIMLGILSFNANAFDIEFEVVNNSPIDVWKVFATSTLEKNSWGDNLLPLEDGIKGHGGRYKFYLDDQVNCEFDIQITMMDSKSRYIIHNRDLCTNPRVGIK